MTEKMSEPPYLKQSRERFERGKEEFDGEEDEGIKVADKLTEDRIQEILGKENICFSEEAKEWLRQQRIVDGVADTGSDMVAWYEESENGDPQVVVKPVSKER